jgi:hypothetical protein
VLVDSTGKAVARALNETIMLVTISSGVAASALIRPIYDSDGRRASGLATWQAGGEGSAGGQCSTRTGIAAKTGSRLGS